MKKLIKLMPLIVILLCISVLLLSLGLVQANSQPIIKVTTYNMRIGTGNLPFYEFQWHNLSCFSVNNNWGWCE